MAFLYLHRHRLTSLLIQRAPAFMQSRMEPLVGVGKNGLPSLVLGPLVSHYHYVEPRAKQISIYPLLQLDKQHNIQE